MRRIPVLAALLCLGAPLSAQVSVQVEFGQEQYLADEPVVADVRITNFSGRSLVLGKDNAWLRFSVESADGSIVNKSGDPPVAEEFTLPSAARATRHVTITPFFNVSRPGHYLVTATVIFPQAGQEINSPAKGLNVIRGAKIWEQEFGVPGAATDASALPEVRRYTLLQMTDRKRMRVYVRTADQYDARVFSVFPLGHLVSFSPPEAQVDKVGRLHVLFQEGARTFSYNVVLPNGELAVRQTHSYSSTRPVLKEDGSGQVAVVGGVRVLTPSDLPKLSNAPPSGEPAPATNAPGDKSPPPKQ